MERTHKIWEDTVALHVGECCEDGGPSEPAYEVPSSTRKYKTYPPPMRVINNKLIIIKKPIRMRVTWAL